MKDWIIKRLGGTTKAEVAEIKSYLNKQLTSSDRAYQVERKARIKAERKYLALEEVAKTYLLSYLSLGEDTAGKGAAV